MRDRTYTDKMKSAPIAYDELLASHDRLLAACDGVVQLIKSSAEMRDYNLYLAGHELLYAEDALQQAGK